MRGIVGFRYQWVTPCESLSSRLPDPPRLRPGRSARRLRPGVRILRPRAGGGMGEQRRRGQLARRQARKVRRKLAHHVNLAAPGVRLAVGDPQQAASVVHVARYGAVRSPRRVRRAASRRARARPASLHWLSCGGAARRAWWHLRRLVRMSGVSAYRTVRCLAENRTLKLTPARDRPGAGSPDWSATRSSARTRSSGRTSPGSLSAGGAGSTGAQPARALLSSASQASPAPEVMASRVDRQPISRVDDATER